MPQQIQDLELRLQQANVKCAQAIVEGTVR